MEPDLPVLGEKGVPVSEEVHQKSPASTSIDYSGVDEKALVRRMDLRILPMIVILYIFAFIDRVNIGNAQLFSLSKDLKLTGLQYNIALCMFFVSYVTFEIPANILMKKVKPHIFMSGCALFFGFLVIMEGLVSNFAGLAVLRFLLGAAEAGIFPGCFYLLSMWYKRSEAQKRFSFFTNASTLGGAFGGLLATGIGHMNGVRGWHAWRWIFILEGLATVLIAVIAYFFIADFPEDAKWLSEAERAFVVNKLKEDQGNSDPHQPITLKGVLKSLSDLKLIVAGFIYFGPTMAGYGLAYFIPTIVNSYGYSPIESQLYSIPPWAAALGFSMICAFVSDKTQRRFPFLVFGFLIAIASVVVLDQVHNKRSTRYAALCLFTMSVFGTLPVIICWFVMNQEGHLNRIVGSAWQIGFGNIGGIIAVFSFPAKDRPFYHLGYRLSIGMICMSLAASVLYLVLCMLENKKRARDGRRKLVL
ncbi:MFS general substrate transporter [Amniculicola lignicola CBS 123094]|uniref:MFS general substrate transporter n=1 Tax=Amniculicola lignicola CBS 123094 TaxID=1392246 RepID=A0A6A5VXC6_9PLEO|nr:MFS general substrate transporter [Amniculicola lignicola CBS 123094]